MVNIKDFKKIDKIEELGNKICRFTENYERRKGRSLELATLVDVLFGISKIFKSHDKRFKKLEEYLKDKKRMMVIK
jgi:hypothetical protein